MSTTNNLKDSQSNIIDGLGVYTHTTTHTGVYSANALSTMNPASSLILTIAQTGSTSVSVSSASPAAAQAHVELQTKFNIVAGDVITVTIASSSPIDEQLNTVLTLVTIRQGLV